MEGYDEVYAKMTKRKQWQSRDQSVKRLHMAYQFAAMPVCRQFFFFINPVGKKRFQNLLQSYDKNGLAPRVHGSANKTPTGDNVLSVNNIEKAVTFITNYAEKFAISLPGRIPGCKDYSVLKLPSADSKISVYRKYSASLQDEPGSRIIKKSAFYNIWQSYVPHITCMKPATDLCDICRTNVLKIQRAVENAEGNHEAAVVNAHEHLRVAGVQRTYYNNWRQLASDTKEQTTFQNIDASFEVLSFDFAEQVHYPSHPQQVGVSYFKTARKCGIFGIHNERNRVQTNYLIDENDNAGRGSSCVVSLIHDYLCGVEAPIIIIFADNCRGQNKNNVLLQYLLWRVLTKKNKKIEYNFMLTGHTKFSPDRGFGILKRKYSLSVVDCLADFVDCVNNSSPNGFNCAKPTVDPQTERKQVIWLDWQSYLNQYFKKFPGLSNFHHFLFEESGRMSARLYADTDFQSVFLQTECLDTVEAVVMEEVLPIGLSDERQWYLFEQIRNLCADDSKKDFVAPRPSVPKPKTKSTECASKILKDSVAETPVKKKEESCRKTIIFFL